MIDLKGVRITWCGHACFRLEQGGWQLYIDPFLKDNPACPAAEKTPRKVEAALLTHGHQDHMADAVAVASQGAAIVGMVELVQWLGGQGIAENQRIGMNKGGAVEVAGVKATMVHALHSTGISDRGQTVYGGEAAGYVLEFPQGLRIYHAGDTDVFGDMALIRELLQPQLALLPIGGHYTMDPRRAAVATKLLGVKYVIPMHYGTWPILTGTPDELKKHLAGSGCEVIAMKPGETLQ